MKSYNANELCLIWLDSFLRLEYKHKKYLYETLNGKSGIKNLIEQNKDYVVSHIGLEEFNTLLCACRQEYLDSVLDGLKRRSVVAITIDSKDYPKELLNTEIPPLVLYCKGNISLLNSKCFSIVGSRKSLPLSVKLSKAYAKELLNAGFTLVTGIAQGVDSAVLQTAIDLNKPAISVLAGGFDNVYPKSNEGLIDLLIKNGLVITEYPPETITQKYFYPIRNRIIAGLSKGVLVTSGALKSGTLHTANFALEYGKDLFSIPYSVGIESGAGCNDLIKRGAILTDTPKDVLDFYGIENKESLKIELSEIEKQIVSLLKEQESTVDKLCNLLNKKVFEVAPYLSMLEIKGVIIKNGINSYSLCQNFMEE